MITRADKDDYKLTTYGLYDDGKPANVANGHLHVEMDTGKEYLYDEENDTWYEQPAGGGGGSGLPPVTDADNGKVLGVVDGEWDKAEASGGYLAVNVIPTHSSLQITGATVDKTYAEIMAAINAGTPVLVMQRPSATGNVVNIGTVESAYSMTYYSNVIIMHIPAFGYDVVLRQNNQVYLATPSGLPAVTSSDNGKALIVENGAWSAGSLTPKNPELWWDINENTVSRWQSNPPDFTSFPNGTAVILKATAYDVYSYRVHEYSTLGIGTIVRQEMGGTLYGCYLDAVMVYDYGGLKAATLHIDFLNSANTTYSYTSIVTDEDIQFIESNGVWSCNKTFNELSTNNAFDAEVLYGGYRYYCSCTAQLNGLSSMTISATTAPTVAASGGDASLQWMAFSLTMNNQNVVTGEMGTVTYPPI